MSTSAKNTEAECETTDEKVLVPFRIRSKQDKSHGSSKSNSRGPSQRNCRGEYSTHRSQPRQLLSDSASIDSTLSRKSRSDFKRRPGTRRNRCATQHCGTDTSPRKPHRSHSDSILTVSVENTDGKSRQLRHKSDPPKRSTSAQKSRSQLKRRPGIRRNRSATQENGKQMLPRKPLRSKSDTIIPASAQNTNDCAPKLLRHRSDPPKRSTSRHDCDRRRKPKYKPHRTESSTPQVVQSAEEENLIDDPFALLQFTTHDEQCSDPVTSSEFRNFVKFPETSPLSLQRCDRFPESKMAQNPGKKKMDFSGIAQHLGRRKRLAYNRVPSSGRLF